MNNQFKTNRLFKTVSLALPLAILCLISCKENNLPDSSNPEKKQTEVQDTALAERMLKYRAELIKKFNDTIPDKTSCDYYYLIFYSGFDSGTAVKFVKKGDTYFLSLKTVDAKDTANQRTEYKTKIDKGEWDRLEYLVDEFDFWKAKKFKNRKVLDGYICFLEGNRLAAGERFHQLIERGSPQYDKMGALCGYIMDYEESLVNQYKQVNK